jgi:menaquinone-specific isochorismate synthase
MTITSGGATARGSSPNGTSAGADGRVRGPARGAGHHGPLTEAAAQLQAVTLEVDPGMLPDLVRAGGRPERYLWGRSDLTLLGVGEALRLSLPAGWASPAHASLVRAALGAVRTEDDLCVPGSGPVALGALPYDPGRPGHLSMPQLVVARHHGTAWATVTGPTGAHGSPRTIRRRVEQQLAELRAEPREGTLPDRFELGANMPHVDWKHLVARAVKEMEGGSLSKVVLARQVGVRANRPFVLHDVLSRLASLYPSCAVFHVEGFLGASPETLLRRRGAQVESHPLAGTVARSGDPATDEALVAALMSSPKDRHEHQLVVDEIVATLRPICASLDVPDAPSVMPLRNVSHLGTDIRGTLRSSPAHDALLQDASSHDRLRHDGEPGNGRRELTATGPGAGARLGDGHLADGQLADGQLPTSLEIAALLQPTPAVGGLPMGAALDWQRDNEGFDRGTYAGPVGWVDSRGDGEWVLGLRCASVSGNSATLYAGNGIVAGSDPDAELAETQLKLQALLAALVRP